MAATYSENFESYTVGTAISANPPNYTVWTNTGTLTSWQVQTLNGSKCAKILTNAAGWYFATYQGAGFTALSYTDLSVTMRPGINDVNDTGILFRCSTESTGVWPNGYSFGYDSLTSVRILKHVKGSGGPSVLANGASASYMSGNVLRVIAIGSTLNCFENGILKYSVVDTAYATGGIGFTTSEQDNVTGTGWDNVVVNTSPNANFARRRGRR